MELDTIQIPGFLYSTQDEENVGFRGVRVKVPPHSITIGFVLFIFFTFFMKRTWYLSGAGDV